MRDQQAAPHINPSHQQQATALASELLNSQIIPCYFLTAHSCITSEIVAPGATVKTALTCASSHLWRHRSSGRTQLGRGTPAGPSAGTPDAMRHNAGSHKAWHVTACVRPVAAAGHMPLACLLLALDPTPPPNTNPHPCHTWACCTASRCCPLALSCLSFWCVAASFSTRSLFSAASCASRLAAAAPPWLPPSPHIGLPAALANSDVEA